MLLPFPEFRPDVADYMATSTKTATNVLPRGDGYGPVKALTSFTSALADGNDTYTKVLLHFDGADAATTITDSNSGGSAHTWTASGNAQIDTAQFKFGGASGLFDGTGDYVSASDHADFTLGSGDWTVDLWFKLGGGDGAILRMAGQADSSLTATTRSFMISRTAANIIQAQAFVGASGTVCTGTTTFTTAVNTGWHHVALVRTGNTLKLFIDGVQEGGDQSITGTVNDSANALSVGRLGEEVANNFNGWIDEFRLSVGIARWTTAFTTPSKAYDAATNGINRGYFYARKTDGSVAIFAATSTKLLKLNNTDFSFADVSKGGLAYTALSSGKQWRFAQFGNFVFAVQQNVVPQVFDLSSSTEFANLGGSPPQAGNITVVGRFVVLSDLLSNPYRVQWSGLNATTTWTSGTNSSDFQDLPDGGAVRAVAGSEQSGAIFQESTIRRMTYVPGSPLIFSIERVTEDVGILAPYSLVSTGNVLYWLAAQGFMRMVAGGVPEPIGKERIDRTFLATYDSGALHLIIGATDPEASRVYFTCRTGGGSAAAFDKIWPYDYGLNKWGGIISTSGEYLATMARPGITLENLDTISVSIDALSFSLDDVSTAALSKLSAINTSHQLGFFSGDNLEATIETAEQEISQRRVRVKGLRPITDAPTVYGSVSSRETVQAAAVYSTEQLIDARGLCPANVSTRLARGHFRFPAATVWTYALGADPKFVQEGAR